MIVHKQGHDGETARTANDSEASKRSLTVDKPRAASFTLHTAGQAEERAGRQTPRTKMQS